MIKYTFLAEFLFSFFCTRKQQQHYNITKNKVISPSKPTLKVWVCIALWFSMKSIMCLYILRWFPAHRRYRLVNFHFLQSRTDIKGIIEKFCFFFIRFKKKWTRKMFVKYFLYFYLIFFFLNLLDFVLLPKNSNNKIDLNDFITASSCNWF